MGHRPNRKRTPSDKRKQARRAAERTAARLILGDPTRKLTQAEARAVMMGKVQP